MSRETIKLLVSAAVTLVILGVMSVGVLTNIDVGPFEQFGMLVIGYWFGAGAQSAVSKAGQLAEGDHKYNPPSVL